MIGAKKELIPNIIEKEGQYVTTEILNSYGLNVYDIRQLISDNHLERMKRGLYKWIHFQQEYDEMVEVAKIVPEGVFCLFSALSYHELTTYIPKEHNVAIQRTMRKPILPKYPPIKIVYLSKERFETGIIEVKTESHKIKIYNLEKTICDAVIYRNKIGVDIVKEAMERYINNPRKNLQTLIEYAQKLRIYNMIKTYMEVLV